MPRAHYTFISPDLERTYSHFKISLGVVHKYLLMGSSLSCLIGLLFAQRPVLAGIENYEWENGRVWNTTFIEARKALGFTGRITLKETVESLDPNHPLHELEKKPWEWISYSFGSNIHNYCQRVPFLNETTLPSLIRLLEFRSDSQLFFRNAVLCSLCIRMFFSAVSANYILYMFNHRPLVRISTFFLPFFDAIWMCFAMLILCLQKDQDRLMRPWMYWHLPLFAISFAAYSILYVIFTAAVFQQSWRTIVQFLCVCVFCTSMPQACNSYLDILKDGGKPCYFDVPLFIGLAEYAAIASVYLFVCTQFHELDSFEGIITLCRMEYDDYFHHTEDYSSVFSPDDTSSTLASTLSSSYSTTN